MLSGRIFKCGSMPAAPTSTAEPLAALSHLHARDKTRCSSYFTDKLVPADLPITRYYEAGLCTGLVNISKLLQTLLTQKKFMSFNINIKQNPGPHFNLHH